MKALTLRSIAQRCVSIARGKPRAVVGSVTKLFVYFDRNRALADLGLAREGGPRYS